MGFIVGVFTVWPGPVRNPIDDAVFWQGVWSYESFTTRMPAPTGHYLHSACRNRVFFVRYAASWNLRVRKPADRGRVCTGASSWYAPAL